MIVGEAVDGRVQRDIGAGKTGEHDVVFGDRVLAETEIAEQAALFLSSKVPRVSGQTALTVVFASSFVTSPEVRFNDESVRSVLKPHLANRISGLGSSQQLMGASEFTKICGERQFFEVRGNSPICSYEADIFSSIRSGEDFEYMANYLAPPAARRDGAELTVPYIGAYRQFENGTASVRFIHLDRQTGNILGGGSFFGKASHQMLPYEMVDAINSLGFLVSPVPTPAKPGRTRICAA